MKNYIDMEVLEQYYRSCIYKSADGRDCVSIELAEKMILLEIYKTLCIGVDKNINDGNKSGEN